MKEEIKGLYLDDNRTPRVSSTDTQNINWTIVRDYNEFTAYIEAHGIPDLVSFDHDLSIDHVEHLIEQAGRPTHLMALDYAKIERTGYHCAKWLCNYCLDNGKKLPQILTIHSANPAGSDNIYYYLYNYAKVAGETSKIYKTIW
jgi:hypothetical protein